MKPGQPYNPYKGVNAPKYGQAADTAGPMPTEQQFMTGGGGMSSVNRGGIFGAGQTLDKPAYDAAMRDYNIRLKEGMLAAGRNPDGSPIAPEFQSLIDPKTGRLIGGLQMSLEGIPGYEQFSEFATGEGPSRYAEAAGDELGLLTSIERDRATREAGQQTAKARGDLAMRGGLTTGARERIGSQGMTMGMEGRQMARQGQQTGLANILTKDSAARQGALAGLMDLGAQTEQFNVGAALDEVGAGRGAAWDTYKTEGEHWAAKKKADEMAQNRGGGGGGGCCFIFLEARYGDGTMDEVVRRFRDEHMTDKNKRGYYKVSEVLVPLMRKSKVVRFLVRATMTDPLVSYGKYHYGKGKLGKIFKPLKNFWLKVFNYLGDDHEFIRENGEVI
jgi:hypothetical protein